MHQTYLTRTCTFLIGWYGKRSGLLALFLIIELADLYMLVLIFLQLLFRDHIATLEVDLMHGCWTRCFNWLVSDSESFWRGILLVAAAGHWHVEEGHIDDVAGPVVGLRLLQILLLAQRGGGLAHALILLAEVAECVRPQQTTLSTRGR